MPPFWIDHSLACIVWLTGLVGWVGWLDWITLRLDEIGLENCCPNPVCGARADKLQS